MVVFRAIHSMRSTDYEETTINEASTKQKEKEKEKESDENRRIKVDHSESED